MEKEVLTLTVSKEWFDMIVSGEKNEEYRVIKGFLDELPSPYQG